MQAMGGAARDLYLEWPALHKGQLRILRNASRFNVVCCGRRWGKTEFLIDRAIHTSVELSAPYGWFAPTYKILTEPYERLKEILKPVLRRKSDTDKRLDLITGGSIEFWSADVEDTGKSRKYQEVGIDEAAMIKKLLNIWQGSIRPTLTDLRGGAYFTSTPKGLNDFHTLYKKQAAGAKGWSSFTAPTWGNPYISRSELLDAEQDLPSLIYAQEYKAEFVQGAGALVAPSWIQSITPPPRDQMDVCMGVDFASSEQLSADFTAVGVVGSWLEGTTVRYIILDVDLMRGTLHEILAFIRRKYEIWHPRLVVVEDVQAQKWAGQELIRTTAMPVQQLNPQEYGSPKKDKVGRSQSLRARYEHGLVYHSTAITQLAEYEDQLLSFPVGRWDDAVDAVVYAYWPFYAAENSYGAVRA